MVKKPLSKFLEYSPAVILMDIGMPVVDGYQATEAIRQLSSKVPIVAVTAFAYDEDKAESNVQRLLTVICPSL